MSVCSGEKVNREKGVALVTVLMFLMVMMIIGVAAMQSSTLQQWMSGSSRDQDISFQAAENAARQGEAWIEALVVPPPMQNGNCSAPCLVVWKKDAPEINSGLFLDHVWWNAGTNIRSGAAITGVPTPPKLVVEYVGFSRDSNGSLLWASQPYGGELYRVTARGTGVTDDSRSVVQSTYSKRF